jgi:hypothetical protein
MHDELFAAIQRTARARATVERQRERIERRKTALLPTEAEERLLRTFVATLRLFEERERGLRRDVELARAGCAPGEAVRIAPRVHG